MMLRKCDGALAGWKRDLSGQSLVLTLQIAQTVEALKTRSFETVRVTLNKRQLRSLTRDLVRATQEQNLDLFAKRSWWRVWGRSL